MAKTKPAGEGKMGLIIALAFFVIASIALGVFAYQFNSQVEDANNKAKEAADKEKKATELLLAANRRVAMYKTFVGGETFLTPEEKTALDAAQATDPLRAEQQALITRVRDDLRKVQGVGQFDADNFIRWDWPAGGKLAASPVSAQNRPTTLPQEAVKLVVSAETLRGQAAAAKQAADAALTAYNAATTDYNTAKGDLDMARTATVNEKNKVVTDLAAAKKAAAEAYDNEFTRVRGDLKKAELGRNQALQEKDQLGTALAEKTEKLEIVQRKARATEETTLPFDLPKGKIVSRKGNVVEINLGMADKLQAGVRFSVQPLDYQDKGEQSRVRQVFDDKGRPVRDTEGNPVKRPQPKGEIVVIEVLGDHLAKAIVRDLDDIREPVMAEDLLYNASWTRGATQHVVLVGIFDKDGNGTDDIRQVADELNKSGVKVDGYWDLAARKWAVGGPSSRTAYVIVGESPENRASLVGDGLLKERIAITDSIRSAIADAKKAGAEEVSYLKYFPRIGYKVAYGLSDDTINQAAAKYLQLGGTAAPAPEMPPMPPKQ